MFIQLPKKLSNVKETVYYAKAGVRVELRSGKPDYLVDVKDMELAALQSEINFHSAMQQLDASVKKVESILVSKIAVAISMSLPQLPSSKLEKILFSKKLYLAGEMNFAEFTQKMANLFPDRMDNLSDELKAQISAQLVI